MEKYKTKSGDLTPYALACGYIQQTEGNGVQVTLWHEGGPCYHVRAHNFTTHQRIAWESSYRLSDCRKIYRRMVRELTR